MAGLSFLAGHVPKNATYFEVVGKCGASQSLVGKGLVYTNLIYISEKA